MSHIQTLDAHLTNMIAAGEVVERPMGVVKELVENSIDANAKNIDIHIKQGGLEEIAILDDGCGMNFEDAQKAFERHATSKIHRMEDLWNIATMGFRGEALPSIASVSKVILKTNDGKEASEIAVEYGIQIKANPVACNQGTHIIVQNLFQKTPARLKHLKSVPYEFSLISDVVQKFALSRSDIAFTLTHEGKEVFSTSGKGNIQEVIMAIYGREVAKACIPVDVKDDDYQITGQVVQPSQTRASKYYMLFYINQRMVRSYRLQKAIQDAYKEYMPSDRYPIVVLHIEMDPKLVDVNVHPSKWEVRLSKEKQLETLLTTTINDALQGKLAVNKVVREPKAIVETPQMEFTYSPKIAQPVMQKVQETDMSYQEETSKLVLQETAKKDEVSPYAVKKEEISDVKILIVEKELEEIPSDVDATHPSLPQMSVIGQLHGCYILCQGERGMYIIDQHAAQERYHYEQIQDVVLSGIKDVQPLLVPLRIESTMRAVAQVDEINQLLNQIGLHLETFGNHTFIVRELPIWVSHVEEEHVIQDMIEVYLKNKEVNLQELRKQAIASMACHSSIRFNRHLTIAEMQQVIDDLRKCKQPFHCPHGRPTFIELTLKDLEKDFLRVK